MLQTLKRNMAISPPAPVRFNAIYWHLQIKAGINFGEPALDLMDFLQTDSQGRGNINLLAADKLMNTPKLYATFLLWMSELFEQLPEVGDLNKPKLVFFFDEAHLLFDNASPALQERLNRWYA